MRVGVSLCVQRHELCAKAKDRHSKGSAFVSILLPRHRRQILFPGRVWTSDAPGVFVFWGGNLSVSVLALSVIGPKGRCQLPQRGSQGRTASPSVSKTKKLPALLKSSRAGSFSHLEQGSKPHRPLGSPSGRAGERSETERASRLKAKPANLPPLPRASPSGKLSSEARLKGLATASSICRGRTPSVILLRKMPPPPKVEALAKAQSLAPIGQRHQEANLPPRQRPAQKPSAPPLLPKFPGCGILKM